MALPKRQHSRQRGRKRRTHQSLSVPAGILSNEGNKMGHSHRVDPITGYYKGQQIVDVSPKPEKKKGR